MFFFELWPLQNRNILKVFVSLMALLGQSLAWAWSCPCGKGLWSLLSGLLVAVI